MTIMEECMICYDEIQLDHLRRCKNTKCTFHMCASCIDHLRGPECPQCKTIIKSFPPTVVKPERRINLIVTQDTVSDCCIFSGWCTNTCCIFTGWCTIIAVASYGGVMAAKGIGWLTLKICCSPKNLGPCTSFHGPLCIPQCAIGTVVLAGTCGCLSGARQ